MEFSRQAASVLAQPSGDEGGGAAISEIITLSAAGAVVTAVLLWIGYLHRNHKITWLTWLADWFGRRFKRPPWVAMPICLFIASIICALFGFIWDVSLHIGNGRDDGALANPAHYFILIGLFGIFVAGCTAIVLPVRQAGPVGGTHHRRLVRTRRRHRDGGVRPVRADRVPPRRHLAPHLRPGRHPVGPHPPDDDRRRRLLDALGAVPRVRGRASPQPTTPRATASA